MVVLGVIASAIGIAIALSINWFPAQSSQQAHQIDHLFDVLLVASVPVFVLVQSVVVFSVWKFRMRPGEELADGPPIHGNTRVEVLWTAAPALLLISLCSYAYIVLKRIEHNHPNAMKIEVVGQQFAWNFRYHQPGGKVVTSNALYLPKDKPVKFDVKSVDVIHSFWVPQFRIKTDAVPGITTHVRVTPNRVGSFPLVCAELCGLGHSTMRAPVHVLTQTAFAAWLKRQVSPAGAATNAAGAAPSGAGNASASALGKQVFTGSAGCSGCHTLADAGASGTIGPDLDKVLKGKTTAFIRQSIVAPNAFVEKGYPKNVMPQTFGKTLSKAQIDALVNYLARVAK
jgi:cytochrome c oxidase subunit 2